MTAFSGRLLEAALFDCVAVWSGPRSADGARERNFNHSRLLPGLRYEREHSVPLLVSGHGRETELLRAEIDELCRQHNWQQSCAEIPGDAKNTPQNAIATMDYVQRRFGDVMGERTLHVAVYTSEWHRRRCQILLEGLQELRLLSDPAWRRVNFTFIGTPSDEIDHDYLQSFLREEDRKCQFDLDRLASWLRAGLSWTEVLSRL